ncbi:MAG: hypothetical protein NUK65_13735, partial [Firmicutes bacterium]|nr:hypothetical protein [Bacillota bacterium]
VSTASAFEASQLSESEYEGYLEMKEIFPEEVQLLETIAAERKVSSNTWDQSDKNQIVLESEKIVEGQYYHIIATRAGECGTTTVLEQNPSGGYRYAKMRSRLYSYALNLLQGHEFVSNVYYLSIAKGDSSNQIILTSPYAPSFSAWANCTGSPSKSFSSSSGYWQYSGRSAVFEGHFVYNTFRQNVSTSTSLPGIKGQLYLW